MKTTSTESMSELRSLCEARNDNQLSSDSDDDDELFEDCLSKGSSPAKSDTSGEGYASSNDSYYSLPDLYNSSIELVLSSISIAANRSFLEKIPAPFADSTEIPAALTASCDKPSSSTTKLESTDPFIVATEIPNFSSLSVGLPGHFNADKEVLSSTSTSSETHSRSVTTVEVSDSSKDKAEDLAHDSDSEWILVKSSTRVKSQSRLRTTLETGTSSRDAVDKARPRAKIEPQARLKTAVQTPVRYRATTGKSTPSRGSIRARTTSRTPMGTFHHPRPAVEPPAHPKAVARNPAAMEGVRVSYSRALGNFSDANVGIPTPSSHATENLGQSGGTLEIQESNNATVANSACYGAEVGSLGRDNYEEVELRSFVDTVILGIPSRSGADIIDADLTYPMVMDRPRFNAAVGSPVISMNRSSDSSAVVQKSSNSSSNLRYEEDFFSDRLSSTDSFFDTPIEGIPFSYFPCANLLPFEQHESRDLLPFAKQSSDESPRASTSSIGGPRASASFAELRRLRGLCSDSKSVAEYNVLPEIEDKIFKSSKSMETKNIPLSSTSTKNISSESPFSQNTNSKSSDGKNSPFTNPFDYNPFEKKSYFQPPQPPSHEYCNFPSSMIVSSKPSGEKKVSEIESLNFPGAKKVSPKPSNSKNASKSPGVDASPKSSSKKIVSPRSPGTKNVHFKSSSAKNTHPMLTSSEKESPTLPTAQNTLSKSPREKKSPCSPHRKNTSPKYPTTLNKSEELKCGKNSPSKSPSKLTSTKAETENILKYKTIPKSTEDNQFLSCMEDTVTTNSPKSASKSSSSPKYSNFDSTGDPLMNPTFVSQRNTEQSLAPQQSWINPFFSSRNSSRLFAPQHFASQILASRIHFRQQLPSLSLPYKPIYFQPPTPPTSINQPLALRPRIFIPRIYNNLFTPQANYGYRFTRRTDWNNTLARQPFMSQVNVRHQFDTKLSTNQFINTRAITSQPATPQASTSQLISPKTLQTPPSTREQRTSHSFTKQSSTTHLLDETNKICTADEPKNTSHSVVEQSDRSIPTDDKTKQIPLKRYRSYSGQRKSKPSSTSSEKPVVSLSERELKPTRMISETLNTKLPVEGELKPERELKPTRIISETLNTELPVEGELEPAHTISEKAIASFSAERKPKRGRSISEKSGSTPFTDRQSCARLQFAQQRSTSYPASSHPSASLPSLKESKES